MIDFGKNLKNLRLRAGLTQKQLAEKLGVTSSVVSYYELSERNPSPEILIKLAHIFHISTDELLGIDKSATSPLDISGLSDDDIDYLKKTIAILKRTKQL